MLVMAFLSMFAAILAGKYASFASSGFACNLRDAMYKNIQTFSFADIDRFSTSGLVTRMTTDVSNLQNAYQQILRVTVRAPFRLILSICMCLFIDARLSVIFILAMVILSFSLYHIISRVARMFQKVFEQYDELNLKVQENVQAIRVVKAFVREKYENEKFAKAAEGLYWLYVRAESLMALNHPIMNMVVYGCMIALSWFGAHYIVEGTLTTGELTSLFTYVMSILMSLMMLSMVFIMLTQSAASGRRVTEVINLKTDITNPENPVTVVADGNHEMTVFVPGLDGQMQRHTLAAVLHGIVHQIIYNVREVHFVHTDFCLLRVQMSLYLAAVLTHLQREGLYHAVNLCVGVELLPLEGNVAGIVERHLQHLLHLETQALGLGDDDAGKALVHLLRLLQALVGKHLRGNADGGDRRLEFVRKIVNEVVLHLSDMLLTHNEIHRKEEGQQKKAHWHLMIVYGTVKTMDQAQEDFQQLGGVGCEKVRDIRQMCRRSVRPPVSIRAFKPNIDGGARSAVVNAPGVFGQVRAGIAPCRFLEGGRVK